MVAFLLVLTISSCRSVKSVSRTNKQTKVTEKKEVTTDSTNVVERNREINNEYVIPLKTADSLTNKRIKQVLANFKAGVKSGSNSTRIVFDEDALAFKIAAIVGETQNQTISAGSEVKTEKSFEENTDEYISKKIRSIPWWFYALIVFWFFPQILQRVKTIINPLSGLFK